MNRVDNELDLFMIMVSDRRYLMERIEMFEHILMHLETELPGIPPAYGAIVGVVIQNYILPQLERDLQEVEEEIRWARNNMN